MRITVRVHLAEARFDVVVLDPLALAHDGGTGPVAQSIDDRQAAAAAGFAGLGFVACQIQALIGPPQPLRLVAVRATFRFQSFVQSALRHSGQLLFFGKRDDAVSLRVQCLRLLVASRHSTRAQRNPMTSNTSNHPVAISRITEDDNRDAQNLRALRWLADQEGGPVIVVTPQKDFDGDSLKRLIKQPGVTQHTWRGFSVGSLRGRRVVYCWPDRQHLNDLWDATPDALVVIEHGGTEAEDWIEDVNPVQLLKDATVPPRMEAESDTPSEPLPNGVDGILEYVASMAAGYSSGLKWNEEDMLKADMMNRPDRWVPVTVEQVRAKCRELGMRPNDVDTVAGFLQRRKDGRRFNVRSSYKDFEFN